MPKWEDDARGQIKNLLPKRMRALKALKDRDAVEADTRTFVTDILVDVLGYDKYEELTAEYLVRGEFADIGVRVAGELRFFVEIKRITMPLKEQHLRQVKNYAANEGVEFVVLTNGIVWQVYHISNTTPIQETLLFEIDLLEQKPAEKEAKLFPLSRNAITRGVLESIWKDQMALEPRLLLSTLSDDSVVAAVRKVVRGKTGILTDKEKLRKALEQLSN